MSLPIWRAFWLALLSSHLSFARKITHLHADNFEDHVFLDNDPWIIGIEEKISYESLEVLYEKVKDRIKIGIIGEEEFKTYLREQGANEKRLSFKRLRVYPFGSKTHKSLNWEDADSREVAVSKVFRSTPDVTNQLPNVIDGENAVLRDFIQQAYATVPIKFPVILFTDDRAPLLFYKLLSLKFSALFHFAVIERAPLSTLAVFNVFKVPQMMVLLTDISDSKTPRIKPVPYNDELQGSLSYPTAMRFLYLVHKQFFQDLLRQSRTSVPADFSIDEFFEPHFSHFPELLQLPSAKSSDHQETRRKHSKNKDEASAACNENLDVCLIMVFNSAAIENHLFNGVDAELNSISRKIRSQGKSINVSQMNLNCNEEMEVTFDIYHMDLPVLLLLRPRQHLYATAILKEIPMTIKEFVEQALLGKIGHFKYKQLPEFKVGPCTHFDGNNGNSGNSGNSGDTTKDYEHMRSEL